MFEEFNLKVKYILCFVVIGKERKRKRKRKEEIKHDTSLLAPALKPEIHAYAPSFFFPLNIDPIRSDWAVNSAIRKMCAYLSDLGYQVH